MKYFKIIDFLKNPLQLAELGTPEEYRLKNPIFGHITTNYTQKTAFSISQAHRRGQEARPAQDALHQPYGREPYGNGGGPAEEAGPREGHTFLTLFSRKIDLAFFYKKNQEIYSLCSEYDLLIVEDDPYFFVRFEDSPIQVWQKFTHFPHDFLLIPELPFPGR